MTKKTIDTLLEKYWQGDTSLEEEAQLQAYFQSDDVLIGHRQLIPLFKTLCAKKNIKLNPTYTPTYWTKVAADIPKSSPVYVKNNNILRLRKWAVAASFLLLLGVSAWFVQKNISHDAQSVAINQTDEALLESQEAINYMLSKLHKAQEATKPIKHLQSINILK